jgi:hypothetical protein
MRKAVSSGGFLVKKIATSVSDDGSITLGDSLNLMESTLLGYENNVPAPVAEHVHLFVTPPVRISSSERGSAV